MIAYIDESKAKNYLLVMNLVLPSEQTYLRRALSAQLLAGQRSFHFTKESNRRRTQLVRHLLGLNFRVVVFSIKGVSNTESRKPLIVEACKNIRKFEISNLVFELDQSCYQNDMKLLNEIRPEVSWDHRERHQEPLLWVADAVAWCVNRGGEWERMVRPMIVQAIHC